jgi:undecaprenyl-diphosphatase
MHEVDDVEETRAGRRFGARAVLAFIAVGLVAIPFAILTVLVTSKSNSLARVDDATTNALHNYAIDHPTFTDTMSFISTLARPLAWWIVLTPLCAWLLVIRRIRLAGFVAVTALGSSLLNLLIKTVVDRARPHLVDPVAAAAGTSFPSGHTQSATVGFAILVVVFLPVVPRSARILLWVGGAVGVVLVGFSRIALGVHYLSDVIGALVIGSAWAIAMTAAFSAWRRELAPSGRESEAAAAGVELRADDGWSR